MAGVLGQIVRKSVRGVKCRSEAGRGWWEKIVEGYLSVKAGQVVAEIEPYLKGRVLDVGLGMGTVACELMRQGFKVEGIDVEDVSIYADIKPKVYDGKKLPYRNKSFDTALLISVLHHCGENRREVLRETMRVAKQVVMIEDTYRNEIERWWVGVHDQLSNWEFYDHKYLKHEEWKKMVRELGGRVVHSRAYSQLAFGYYYSRYCLLVIE